MEIRGNSQRWGDASPKVKAEIRVELCKTSKNLSLEDRDTFLAIAQFESGLNPSAKATQTTASGVFQIVKNTAKGLGLSLSELFNAKENIKAGLKLFMENMRNKVVPKSGVNRGVMLYALHHDGPTLAYGGLELAKTKFLQTLDRIKSENWSYSRTF